MNNPSTRAFSNGVNTAGRDLVDRHTDLTPIRRILAIFKKISVIIRHNITIGTVSVEKRLGVIVVLTTRRDELNIICSQFPVRKIEVFVPRNNLSIKLEKRPVFTK